MKYSMTYITLWIYLRFVEKDSSMYQNGLWFAWYETDTNHWIIEKRHL